MVREQLSGCDQPPGNSGSRWQCKTVLELGSVEEMAWELYVSSERRRELVFLFYPRLLGCWFD